MICTTAWACKSLTTERHGRASIKVISQDFRAIRNDVLNERQPIETYKPHTGKKDKIKFRYVFIALQVIKGVTLGGMGLTKFIFYKNMTLKIV